MKECDKLQAVSDCSGAPLPVFGKGFVTECKEAAGARPAGSVFLLKVQVPDGAGDKGQTPLPLAGQFYLLRAEKSGVLLGRPISVYAASRGQAADGTSATSLEFLILQKGSGTRELCSLENGDGIS
mgnify:FL=1